MQIRRSIIAYGLLAVSLMVTLCLTAAGFGEKKSGNTLHDIPVLLYHSINDVPIGETDLSVKLDSFDEEMKYLSENGYTPLFINEIQDSGKYKKPIVVTLDDGYEDNYTNAYPILKKYNIKATIFVITNSIGANGHMTADQMRAMEDIVSFQSHTANHLNLCKLNNKQLAYEFATSKRDLSKATKKEVYAVAYPGGSFNSGVVDIARQYYDYGIATLQGLNGSNYDRYMIRRSAISRFDSMKDFLSRLN